MTAFGSARLCMTVWALVLAAACTVGGGGSSPTAGGGIGGTGITSGEITDFGSIEVNGAFYDIGGATITVDGQPANESALKLGMVVDVKFQLSVGKRVATSVLQDDVVNADVAASDLVVVSEPPDPLIATLTALNQKVLITEDTNLFDVTGKDKFGKDGKEITFQQFKDAVSADTRVEVSGHVIESGVIEATYIKVNTPPATTVLRGIVKDHMPNAMPPTFQIGDLVIDYGTQPADISKMPDPATTSWNDLLVQVLGQSIGPAGELIAKKVEPKKVEAGDGDLVEVEGFVTDVVTLDLINELADFTLETTRVQTSATTTFEGGDLEDIHVGAKLEVKGTFDNGILLAQSIKFKDNVKLESNIVAPFDPTTNMLTLEGLPGVTVIVTGETKFQSQGLPKLSSLNDFVVGDHVRVQGREASSGDVVIARRVQKRTTQPSHAILQGPVDSASDPDVTILKVTADTSDPAFPSVLFDFKDVDDTPISRAVFFGSVSTGTVVKLKGTLSGGVVDWDEAQLEDD